MSFRYDCLNVDALCGLIANEEKVSDHDFRLLTKQSVELKQMLLDDLSKGKFKFIIAKGVEYELKRRSS